MKKYLFLYLAICQLTTYAPAMDVLPPPSNEAREGRLTPDEITVLVTKLFNDIWWQKGTSRRVEVLEDKIKDIFSKYSSQDVESILTALTKKFIDNIGGYSAGLTSKVAGSVSGTTTTSDNLVLGHYVRDLMGNLHMPLAPNCETWQMAYGKFNVPYKQKISCSAYLDQYPIKENEKHQENLLGLLKTYRMIDEQRKLGVVDIGQSFFEDVNPSNDNDEEAQQASILEIGLNEGFDAIKKLGMFYGALAERGAEDQRKMLQPFQDKFNAMEDGSAEKNQLQLELQAANIQINVSLQRYATEINNFKAVNPDNIKVTSDGTAMVMAVNNEISIVFGGMGVGPGGMEEGQKLAYKFNNPPLAFQSGLGGAHEGFFIRLMKSWNEIYQFCADYAQNNGIKLSDLNYKIIGHSMGGGVAPIAALRLALITFKGVPGNHIHVITFGAPRSLDATLANTYNNLLGKNTFMFVHDGDSNIPEQPPTFLGYVHVGKRFFIPQPNVSADSQVNRKVFHQYAGYKNVLDTCENAWNTRRASCASVSSEVANKGYYLETGKNILLAPLRGVASIFSGYSNMIEDQYKELQ